MKKIFEPKTIAIVGASSLKGKIGNILMKNLQQNNSLKLYPVNIKRPRVMGIKAYPSVMDIKNKVDIAIIAVPAMFVGKIVEECACCTHPIQNIIIISAGFSEIGEKGREREKKIIKLADKYKLNIIGPNCLGVVNTHYGLNASFAKRDIPKGKIGFIAQSGALTTALFDLLKEHGLGFSLVATLGNKANVDENDFIEFFASDPETKIIALYLEDITDGKRFAAIINKISRRKPIVIIKAGSSKKAQLAIQSHTGAMAGNADIIQEVIKDNGGIICNNLPDFVGILKLLNGFKRPLNKNTVFITNAGGPGVIATDLTESREDVSLYTFSEKEKNALKKYLPAESSVENPVDVLGDAMEDRYKNIFHECAKFKKIGSVCVIVTPQAQTPISRIASEISAANRKYNIPFVPIVIGGEAYHQATSVLNKYGHSSFIFPYQAIRSLSKYIKYADDIKRDKKIIIKELPARSGGLIEKLKKERRAVLLYDEARSIGEEYKLNILSAKIISGKDDVKKINSGFPLVAKVDSPNILHKNAKGGLSLNILNSRELIREFDRLKKLFKDDQVIVQKQVEQGLELIIGIKKDSVFGHILMLGLGGVFTEALNVKCLWLLPVSQKQIVEKIRNSPLAKIIHKKKINISRIAKEAEKVGKIVQKHAYINELDVNPIMMYPDKKPVIVDIKIIVDIKGLLSN
ncbi:MAG: acetate--CoA ligase family protein [Patescibacteria group bacterium]|nr:acetate--CoA ligase family protein [Patescibacteria group bacterium]